MIAAPLFKMYDGYYVVDFRMNVRKFSSAPINGGYGSCERYLNRTVPRNFSADPVMDGIGFLRSEGIDFNGTCMTITACDVGGHSSGNAEADGHNIYSWVTAGSSNALSMGSNGEPGAGTVNIAVATDAPLSDSASFNLIQSIVEAKSQLFNDLGIRDKSSGRIAPGTSTDTVSLFVMSRLGTLPYAGRLTGIGRSTADLVYDLVGRAITMCI